MRTPGDGPGGVRVIASLGAGDFFGETALIEKRETRAADVYCTSPVEASYLDVAHFELHVLAYVLLLALVMGGRCWRSTERCSARWPERATRNYRKL